MPVIKDQMVAERVALVLRDGSAEQLGQLVVELIATRDRLALLAKKYRAEAEGAREKEGAARSAHGSLLAEKKRLASEGVVDLAKWREVGDLLSTAESVAADSLTMTTGAENGAKAVDEEVVGLEGLIRRAEERIGEFGRVIVLRPGRRAGGDSRPNQTSSGPDGTGTPSRD